MLNRDIRTRNIRSDVTAEDALFESKGLKTYFLTHYSGAISAILNVSFLFSNRVLVLVVSVQYTNHYLTWHLPIIANMMAFAPSRARFLHHVSHLFSYYGRRVSLTYTYSYVP